MSYLKGLPVSFFSKVSLLPNTVDADWKFKDGVYVPDAGGDAEDAEAAAPATVGDQLQQQAQKA